MLVVLPAIMSIGSYCPTTVVLDVGWLLWKGWRYPDQRTRNRIWMWDWTNVEHINRRTLYFDLLVLAEGIYFTVWSSYRMIQFCFQEGFMYPCTACKNVNRKVYLGVPTIILERAELSAVVVRKNDVNPLSRTCWYTPSCLCQINFRSPRLDQPRVVHS